MKHENSEAHRLELARRKARRRLRVGRVIPDASKSPGAMLRFIRARKVNHLGQPQR
jgi:hypothetical protein